MSHTVPSLRGELHVDGPGARRVPVHLDGRGRSLRIEVGAGWPSLAKLGSRPSARHVPAWLRRRGLAVTLVLGDRPVMELGRGTGSGVRIRPLAALQSLLGVPLRDIPRVVALGLGLLRGAPEPVPARVRPPRPEGRSRG